MVKFHMQFQNVPSVIWKYFSTKWIRFKINMMSLFYNDHLNSSYVADILMEPVIWFVDNFTGFLGPFFVAVVIGLNLSVVFICYIIGLPYWWERNWIATIFLLTFGHWLLINVAFHYYMGCTVLPGLPPEGTFIPEAVSMCKKCISPKPPRTHHCSVCNKCILKMDHHCPWLNNCVGFWNHRHFFLYMLYTTLGVAFLITFGLDLFLERVWWLEEELEGHPVRFKDSVLEPITDSNDLSYDAPEKWQRGAIIYTALICIGTFIALGSLTAWHARLISRGETSIEGNINKRERARYASQGQIYLNPYDLGWRRNWTVFLGINDLPPFQGFRKVLWPSFHKVQGNGLTWPSSFSMPSGTKTL